MKKSCYEVILEISIYLQNQVIDFSKTIFFNFAALNNAIRDEIVKCIETQKKNVISDIQNLLNKEKSRCFTLNPYYSDIILKVKNRILEYKKGSPTSSNQPNTINDISFTNNYLNSGNIYKAHFDNEMGVQNFQISLFAYFKVFEKRFVDYFCLSIFEHFIYYFDDGSIFLHNDMRQFGYVRLLEKDELGSFFTTFKIGPEPLERSFSLNKFKTLLATKPRLKIKPLLMDQTFLAGIGNLYAQEACWHAKILPNRFVKSLKEKEIECLYTSLRNILREAIKCKGSTVDTYVDANDEPGDYVKKIKVYSREHQTCLRCGEKIIKIILSGRGTCYCPNCQK